jgi:hypothetical protein
MRQMCRNPGCGTKLKAPVENKHHAFCTAGCYQQFFRHRCVVCEEPMERSAAAWHQRTCGKRECRKTLRKSGSREQYRYPSARSVFSAPRSADEMGVKIPWRERSRVWKAVAGPELSHINLIVPLDPDTARRVADANARFQAEGVLDRKERAAIEEFEKIQAGRKLSEWAPTAKADPNDPGLEIPEFLRRRR